MSEVQVHIEQPERAPLRVVLDRDLVIGRDCEGLLLADPQVSRRHLRLQPRPDAVVVSDLGSTNGSWIGDDRLTEPRVLGHRATVRIGDTLVTVELDGTVDPKTTELSKLEAELDLRSTSIGRVADAVASQGADLDTAAVLGDTVTIVFSDIESSTARATAMGDAAWFELLEGHNALIRSAVTEFGGREVKSIGDGFMLTFPGVHRALDFAVAVQRRIESPDGPDLRVRMGLHTGEAIESADGDLFGRHVNLAARVANLAGGGQIVASLVVHEIAAGRDHPRFGEPQQVRLKGFAEPETVFEVRWDD